MTYPPEPWDLRGRLHLTVWHVPVTALPALPPGVRPVRLGAAALVGTAWVDYRPGGVLSYQELLAAVLVRGRGAHPEVSITNIWVDSDASRRGGRALWGIPKQLAIFDFDGPRFAATQPGGAPIAHGTVRPGVAVPGRWPARYTVVQASEGALARTPVRSTAGLRHARARWEFAADGPLGWLAAARPLVSVSLADFRLRFGPRRR